MDTDVANNYIAEDGSGMEYIRDNSSQYSNILTKDNIKYSFGNTDGKLHFITNLVTNKTLSITYYFADHIWHVDDSKGNKIQFYYDSSWKLIKTQLQLKKSDGNLRIVEEKRYYYDSYGNIDYIEQDFNYGTEPSTIATGPTLQYTFYPWLPHLLIEAYNTSDNYKVYYHYYSKYNSSKVDYFQLKDINDGAEVILENTSIQYLHHETIYSDIHGYNIKYIFDYWGHTVNVIDSFGNAAFYKYSNPFTCYLDSSDSNNLFDIINEAPDYYNNHKLLESSEPLKQQFNYIQNHGFEECNKNWTIGPYGIIDYSSSEKILGNYSLSLANYVTYGSYAYQDITLDSGSYTIQGWIKNDSSTNGTYIEIFNADTIISSSLPISGTEWKRYDLKFELENPKTISVRLWNTSISTAHFDNVQLVEGLVDEDIDYFIDSRYNIITDNSFENSSSLWELSSGATIESIPNPSDFMHPILGEKAVCINGDSHTKRYVSQTFNPDTIMGNGLTFVIGGWAQSSNAVPNKSYYDGPITSDERFFGLKIILEVAQDPLALENTDTLTYYFPFDPSIEDWQYIMKTISIPDYLYCDQIIIEGIYQGEGKAYFDDFQIYYDRINTEYSYNINGNLTDVSKPSGEQISYGYDSNNQIKTITTRDIITTANYDGLLMNNIIRNNVFVAFHYNPANQLDETQYGKPSEGKWFTSTTKYTTDGQYVSKTIDEFGNVANYTSDQSISAITEIIDTLGTTQNFVYNSYGQLTSTIMTATDSTSIGCSYDYKSDGKLQYITRNGVVYEVVYDDLDRITNLKVSNDVIVTNAYIVDESDYSKSNLLEKQTYGNGYEIKFVYDKEDRIKEVQEKVGEEPYSVLFEYEYDACGKLSIFKDHVNDNVYYYSYDLVGRLKNIIDQNSNEISCGYDSQGNVNHYTYVIEGCEREIDFNYDNQTGLYDQTSYGGVEKNYYYDDDSLSRLNRIELLFASTTLSKDYHYEEDDVIYGTTSTRVCSIVYKKNISTQMIYSYHYYKNNIDDILVTLENGTILEHYSYVYDGFNELIRENYDDGTTSFTKVYTYDGNGNIETMKTYEYTTSDIIDESNLLESIDFDYISDRITKITANGVENNAFTYDEIGNLLTDGTNSYTWNGKELIQVQTSSGTYNYQYNDQGIRTQKEEVYGEITKYYLDGEKVLVEINNNDTIYYAYDVDGSLISMNLNGIEYYYVTNMQGDIIELVAGDGTIVVSYKYDAWGNIIGTPFDISNVDLANKNPYRYRGYRYDNETGFYYLQSRYYNPEIGRFISADSLMGTKGEILSHNLYAYCGNNPIMNIDPNGYSWLSKALLIGAAVAVAVAVVAVTAIALAPALVAAGTVSVAVGSFVAATATTTAIVSVKAAIELYAGYVAAEVVEAAKVAKAKNHAGEEWTVYALTDNDGKVRYVGRTMDLNRRLNEHKHDKCKDLHLAYSIGNLNYFEARGLEQEGMIRCNTRFRTNSFGLNSINGVSPNNILHDIYFDAANYLYNQWQELYYISRGI